MAIGLEGASVIVPVAAIDARYPGSITAYRNDCPNNSYLQDEHLARVGFMSTAEAVQYVGQLDEKGLRATGDPNVSDVVIIANRNLSPSCGWLVIGVHGGIVACWLRGTPPGELVRWRECPIYRCPATSLAGLFRIFQDAGFTCRASVGKGSRLICEREAYRFEVEILEGNTADEDGFICVASQYGRIAGAPNDEVPFRELDSVLKDNGLTTPSGDR